MPEHDIIVIGGSAGGIETLIKVVGTLPGSFHGAIFVVIHFPAISKSYLPQILARSGSLPAEHPDEGEEIKKGKIYVAPPNVHMLLENGRVHLSKGPREHGLRPSVDSLFRTAALAFGPRVVGVVLSGTLYDGAAGSIAIKQHGGILIAQDPQEALYPGMPATVIEQDHVDYVLPALEIGEKLVELSTRPGWKRSSHAERRSNPMDDEIELKLVQNHIASFENGEPVPTGNSILTCPECGGVLWYLNEGDLPWYRCHVGHHYSEESLLVEQTMAVETALWNAVRILEEKAAVTGRLASKENRKGFTSSAKRFTDKAENAERSANIIRELILSGKVISSLDNLPGEEVE